MKGALRHAAMIGALVVAIAASSRMLNAQGHRSILDGVYTEAQAQRGAKLYRGGCAECHGESLEGGWSPHLQAVSSCGAGAVSRLTIYSNVSGYRCRRDSRRA